MPCQNLTPLDKADLITLSNKVVEVSGQYYQCQQKHQALSKAVKGLKNE